ncbi:inositol monophosphatase family protein [Pendulispora albinea]|uniref:Inositol monophosphatase n=1 Tax=Pendulispora albinea TaxID=2741071 RepID=A0ABZ2MBG8_9BACT
MEKPEILDEALERARSLAKEVGHVIRDEARRMAVQYKGDGSEVTNADVAAERVLRERLQGWYPHAQILGEEFGGEPRAVSGWQWILDPIDGTTSFSIGSPAYGTLIGLLVDGEPALGVIHFPATGESYFARSGGGTWFEDGDRPVRVRVSGVKTLGEAFGSTCGIQKSDIVEPNETAIVRLKPIIARARKFRIVGDCLQHALVARGRVDLAIDATMSPWDNAALIPVLAEAGAALGTLRGSRDFVFGGSLISAASPELLEQVLGVLRGDA